MSIYLRTWGALASCLVLAGTGYAEDAFAVRVKRYMQLHQRLERQLPRLKTTGASAVIENHQQELARKIRIARANARQGEIFTPEVSRQFRHLVRSALSEPDADRIRSSFNNAEPAHLTLHVNESYPPGEPLQSPPPTLLKTFPALPAELDYRVVGRSLVLRDTIANVIVDFIPDLLPGPK